MKILVIIMCLILTSCTKKASINSYSSTSIKNIVNQEIIDGFFDGDTTNISKDYFFLE